MSSYQNCTEVSAQCPVDATTYGYYPNLAANAFFLAFFALFFTLNLGLGYWYKTYTYATGLCLACLTEALGYAGRVMMHSNPWNNTGFIMQICCIIIGPAFNSASIYLTLKYITLTFGAETSRIQPYLYTWIFISGDLVSLMLQGAGGGIASSTTNPKTLKTGDNLTMAGIAWQIFTLLAFAVVTIDYVFRRRMSSVPLSQHATKVASDKKFQVFGVAMVVAWVTIFTRCVFRVVEFAGGWGNSIQQNETAFIVLEGVMISLATLSQTVPHPGICFPALSSRTQKFVPEDLKTVEHRAGQGSTSSQDTLTNVNVFQERDQEK